MSQEPRNHSREQHEAQQRQQHEAQQRQQEEQQERGQLAQDQVEPGTRLANPAQPYAETVVPERADASSFMRDVEHPSGYPKLKYHPVHGGIVVKNPGEEAALMPPTDWFDSAELADLARTHTEAEAVRTHNQMVKLKELEEKKHPVVRNSVQADEAIRRAQTEPL